MKLVDRVVEALLSSKKLESLLRQLVLRICLEQKRIQENGVASTFLRACQALQITVTLSEDGGIYCDPEERLPDDLRVVLIMWRDGIARILQQTQGAERDLRKRYGLPTNEMRQGNGKDPQAP